MISATVFLVVMLLAYFYLVFELVDPFLRTPRLKKLYRIPVAILNTSISLAILFAAGNRFVVLYLVMGTLLFLEFIVFYKDKPACSLFCALACLVHIMAMRSFCLAGFAMATHSSLYEIVNTPYLLTMATAVGFMLLNLVIFVVIRVVSSKSIRIINQHSEQLWFMNSWLAVFTAYLLTNAALYVGLRSPVSLLDNQIIAPLAVLLGTYIVLFFSIKTATLLGYKEKNEELRHRVEKERQYRASIDKDVFRTIEVDFNRDELISGFEDYEEKLGEVTHNYTQMLAFMIQASVHPEDRENFLHYSSPLTAIEEFERGKTEIVFDYRRLMQENLYVWMRVLMVLVQDEETGHIKGFVQIKNIDEEKKQQLELQYKAERDSLTGLYNKSTAETRITEYLALEKAEAATGVLFIIDIDNFKTINDRLGHLYGDAVLSELSESLKGIFRESDIVGRIGGDEFLVFAKGLSGEKMIVKRANEICKAFLRTYANEKNEGYTVSSSVGIAVFPKDGRRFEVLFQFADAALYTAKAKGKNRYSFYDEGLELSYVSTRTEIDTHGVLQKSFKENRIEYVFRLLYGSDDTQFAIESVLELIAKNFGFSRANIFEFNELSTHFNGVFEWCSLDIASVSDRYINMPVSSFDFIVSALEESGGMFMAVPTDFPAFAQESYTSIGIKSIVHFSIKERDKLMGVIAFQNCVDEDFKLSETEFEELRTICQVLSVFMAKQLSNVREVRHHQAIEAIMDNMNSIAYVVDRETFEVFYENQNVIDITGHPSVGTKCHVSYRGLDAPCDDCPLQHVSAENPHCTLELYTAKFDIYTKTSAALIEWSNGRDSLLISSVDITEYK